MSAPEQAQELIAHAARVVVGKKPELRLAVSCLIAGGHLLIEDVPGVGKTTLAQLLARLLGLEYRRVQFTSDMLPADVTGSYVYERERAEFRFHPGPIFAHVVLADEINRATPRAQSALLEAMEEGQVTIENETHPLAAPFFVIATQNPLEQVGTFPLPESQLDRFMMCISLGYPDRQAERQLLNGIDRRQQLKTVGALLDAASVLSLQGATQQVHVSEPLLDYVQDLVAHSRSSAAFVTGLSPRAGIAAVRAAQAWALTDGRQHVTPEDVQQILPAVAAHRLQPAADGERGGVDFVRRHLLGAVAIP
ncbi:MAG: AAA family ATPase [Gammaproteobacteria bacterium]